MSGFLPGWRDEVGGIEFRVIGGKKACTDCQRAGWGAYEPCGHDMRLEWWVEDGGWRPVPFLAAALLVDFFCTNEAALYPPPKFQGAEKVFGYLRDAYKNGYSEADLVLRRERIAKRKRVGEKQKAS